MSELVDLDEVELNCGIIDVIDCPLRMPLCSGKFMLDGFPISSGQRPDKVLPCIPTLVNPSDNQNILLPTNCLKVRFGLVVEVSEFAYFFFVFGG